MKSIDRAVLNFVGSLVFFHANEGDLLTGETPLLDKLILFCLWQALLGDDLDRMRRSLAEVNVPGNDAIREVLNCFILDLNWLNPTHKGSTYTIDEKGTRLILRYIAFGKTQDDGMRLREVGRKEYTLTLSADLSKPARAYCYEHDDQFRSATDSESGACDPAYVLSLLSKAVSQAITQRLERGLKTGDYSLYCPYSAEGWAQRKALRDQERQHRASQKRMQEKRAKRWGWLGWLARFFRRG